MDDRRITVLQSDIGERQYELHELVWLWRTAQLPHDAQFQDDEGEWRPLEALVEPIIEAERKARDARTLAPLQKQRDGRVWKFAAFAAALLVLLSAPYLREFYAGHKTERGEEARVSAWERSERIEDFIAGRQVVVGMTPEQVLRAWGSPRMAVETGLHKTWTYSKGTVVFHDGFVSSITSK